MTEGPTPDLGLQLVAPMFAFQVATRSARRFHARRAACIGPRPRACLAPMSSPRPIVFLSDFGLGNEWVGLCHAVMSGISPQCPITDLSHLVRPLEVASGALLLADSVPYIPENAVVLAVF